MTQLPKERKLSSVKKIKDELSSTATDLGSIGRCVEVLQLAIT